MKIFFSGTDWDNLEERASLSNYFLMLIVGFSKQWIAKVAFKAKKEGKESTKLSFINNGDGFKPLVINNKEDEEVLVVMDCIVKIEEDIVVSEEFENRFEEVVKIKEKEAKEAEERRKKSYQQYPPYTNYQSGKGMQKYGHLSVGHPQKGLFDGDDLEKMYSKKPKKLNEMTEKEWRESETGIGKFEIRHAKAFLNSILNGTYQPYDFSDCMKTIEFEESRLTDEEDYDKFMEEFEFSLMEHFDICFPYKTQEDYLALMNVCEDYLAPYTFRNKLVQKMVDSIKDEIDLYDDVPIYLHKTKK